MKGLETGKDKVKKICDALRKETLEPALQEAAQIVDDARREAERIVREGREEAERALAEARALVERERNVFQSSLHQACRQALEALKQTIEEKLFHRELARLLHKQTEDPKVIAALIEAVVHALRKDGIDAPLSAYIPAAVPARSVNALLGSEILERLKEKSVLLGAMAGGASVKLHKENITLDLSDEALKELVAHYIRRDFREMLFGA
jgi:V/A-type H+-transporting ATPase subunit E